MDLKKKLPDQDNTFVRAVYDSLFNFTQDAVVFLDKGMNIIKSNKPFTEITKYCLSSADIGNIFDLIRDEDDRKSFLSVLEDNILMKEITLNSLQGNDFCILQTKLGPIKDNDKIIGVYAIFVDITDFRKREDELNRRYKLICSLVDKANLGIVIIDQNHKVIESNDRFCEMIGYSQEEITKLHSWDWEYVYDEKAIRQGFADLSEISYTFDTIHKRKDGTTYHATVSASGADVFGDGNDVIMYITQDISAKKEMEEKLRLSEKKLRTYLENSADMILTVDYKGEITYISPNCEKICGFKADDLIGKKASDFFLPKDAAKATTDPFMSSLSDDKRTYWTFRMEHRDGTVHWYGVTISKTSDENGRAFLICNARNIDKNIENEMKLRQLGLYDHLTGVPNKAYFDATLKRIQSKGQRPVSVLVCDMDSLKAINDRYGHAKGDEALKIAAELIKSSLRKDDFIARVGGDEFAVILPGAGKDEALRIVERINKTFANHDPGGRPSLISISIGQSTVYDTETSLEDALNWADKDMYSRKQRSKVFPAD